MTDQHMREEELEGQNGEALPDREAMSVIQPVPDPDLGLTTDPPPKESSEPGLPPPRD